MGWLEFRRSNRKTEAPRKKGEFLRQCCSVSTEVSWLHEVSWCASS